MYQYLEHLKTILEKGTEKEAAREGLLPTKSLFGHQWRHNLADGFPLLTTKEVYWKGIIVELFWFLSGETNVKWLNKHGVSFWNEDAYNYYRKLCVRDNVEPMPFSEFDKGVKQGLTYSDLPTDYELGDCGKQYGWLWRHNTDQVYNILTGLAENPTARTHVLSAWNPPTLGDMALHPCHTLVQFNCRPIASREERQAVFGEVAVYMSESELDEAMAPKYYLDCQMYQRSADMFLGVPLNIASYALLTHLFCRVLSMAPGEVIFTYGDSHIYGNVRKEVDLQLSRTPRALPTLWIDDRFWPDNGKTDRIKWFLDLLANDDIDYFMRRIHLEDYYPHPKIEAKHKLLTGIFKQTNCLQR